MLMAALIRTRLSFLRTSRSSDDGVPAGNRPLFAHKKSRSCRHTHFGYADNSGYLVSRIRIRCSVVCHKSDKQAGTAAGFLQPISLAPGSCPCVCPGSTTMVSMMHAYGQDRAAFPTFDTDHAVDVFLHVKKAPAAAGAFYLYARHVLFCHFQIAPLPLFISSGHPSRPFSPHDGKDDSSDCDPPSYVERLLLRIFCPDKAAPLHMDIRCRFRYTVCLGNCLPDLLKEYIPVPVLVERVDLRP